MSLQYSRWWSCNDDVDDRVGKKCGGSVGEESSITYREPLFPPTHHPHIIKCKIFLHTVLMEYSIFYYLFFKPLYSIQKYIKLNISILTIMYIIASNGSVSVAVSVRW